MIKPTVGRIVWFCLNGNKDAEPMPAMITQVHEDGKRVNLFIVAPTGKPFLDPPQNILLVQDGIDVQPSEGEHFCAWMPYQTEQAKRHSDESRDAMQKQIDELRAKVELHDRHMPKSDPSIYKQPTGNDTPVFTPPAPGVG